MVSSKIKSAKAYAKRKQTLRSLNMRLKSVESNVKAQETKKNYRQHNEKVIGNNSTLQINNQINNMNQGDGANDVDGNSYSLTGIAGTFLIHNVSSFPTLMRVAVVRAKSGQIVDSNGTDLFTGSAGLGLDFVSATEAQRYYLPFNSHKYDIVYSRMIKLGGKNNTYTNDFSSNQIVKFYKRFKNRKEFIDNSSGGMDTVYQLIIFPVDCAMDGNILNVEVTGQTCVYYKDN